ncbi:hypothetical protein HBI24_106710 [Parastagonospora nodorum]|nr:hypothetical protein HBI79_012060 [Parastagonospora nodorum]KAH5337986.1 hypothetical protein HBI12_021800 [Parastagonospora nodorum]KAH5446996.1 hypothetical protein HBI47_017910 [Parastagonospora nodorum]KAH5583702.1 hypothetical protein HBI24_106710 [Parastagonospora nodorum]KAH5689023.1 hypothetical protein HBI23_027020 [Parastagonospora nodorum]
MPTLRDTRSAWDAEVISNAVFRSRCATDETRCQLFLDELKLQTRSTIVCDVNRSSSSNKSSGTWGWLLRSLDLLPSQLAASSRSASIFAGSKSAAKSAEQPVISSHALSADTLSRYFRGRFKVYRYCWLLSV